LLNVLDLLSVAIEILENQSQISIIIQEI